MVTETPELDVPPQIPSYLIYEILNGRPLYRKGYKDVLAKRKSPGEIMGGSDLQAIIVSALHGYLYSNVLTAKHIGSSQMNLACTFSWATIYPMTLRFTRKKK